MTGTLPAIDRRFPVTPDTAWSYISGRISVLETQLLGRGFFESLLKCQSMSEARSVLAKTSYRQVFTTDQQVRDYMTILETFSEKVFADIFNDSPLHVMKLYFETNSRYLVFRNLFLKASARGTSVSDIEKMFDALAVSPEDDSLQGHKAALRSREAPQNADGVAKSLFLDSAVCTQKIVLALSAHEEIVSRVLHDMALLECWSAIIRSRWNRIPAEVVLRWFLVPDTYGDFVKDCVNLSDSNPVNPLTGRVSDSIVRKLRSVGSDVLKQTIDSAVSESIRDSVLECRSAPYGPGKVLAYLIAFTLELQNLRMSIASVVNRIDGKIVSERFRREYA